MPAPDLPRHSRATWSARLLAALSLAYATTLVWATHHPRPQDLLGRNPPSDKLLHFAAYAVLGVLVTAAVAAAGRLSVRGAVATAAALALFAVVDEFTQPWFGRSADPFDWACDLAGIAAGAGLVAAVNAWVRLGGAGR